MNQRILREKVKIAKSMNIGLFYKDFAEILDINSNSFYNWLKGYYSLSQKKTDELDSILSDWIDKGDLLELVGAEDEVD